MLTTNSALGKEGNSCAFVRDHGENSLFKRGLLVGFLTESGRGATLTQLIVIVKDDKEVHMRLFHSVLLTGLLAGLTPFSMRPVLADPQPKTATAKQDAALLDLNSAGEDDLKALPGIGDTYAKKIIAGRPYTNKTQLLSRKILPKATYDKVKDKVVAKAIAK
jgi:DNA uptake protein ComE-like DNA-binding protein